MITLPYDFDTASTWQRIVRIALAILGGLVFLAAAAAALGHWAAAAGIVLCMVFFALVARIARFFPMGAVGQITRAEVVCCPVKVFGRSLRVPVGRFPLAQFRSVTLEQRVIVITPAGARDNEDLGSVCLVGANGTPTIEVARGRISAATIVARELASTLALELREVAAPGTRVTRVQLGA